MLMCEKYWNIKIIPRASCAMLQPSEIVPRMQKQFHIFSVSTIILIILILQVCFSLMKPVMEEYGSLYV